jgi:hypothetical protein
VIFQNRAFYAFWTMRSQNKFGEDTTSGLVSSAWLNFGLLSRKIACVSETARISVRRLCKYNVYARTAILGFLGPPKIFGGQGSFFPSKFFSYKIQLFSTGKRSGWSLRPKRQTLFSGVGGRRPPNLSSAYISETVRN